MARRILSSALSVGLLASGLLAQTQPSGFFSTACIKVNAGKGSEYRQFVSDYSHKMMQVRMEAGDIAGWTLLRSVIPAGEDARCDYVSITNFKAAPPPPPGPEGVERALQKAGLKLTAAEFFAKRDALTRLVATEMWRSQIRVAASEKGDYLYVNFMKVHKMNDYVKFEREVWKALAEAWVKDGAMRGWSFSTAFLPGGTERQYAAASVDIFPSWEAVFKPLPFAETFKQVHPGKQQNETMSELVKLRDLARRELYVVHDKVGPAAPVSSQK